MSPRFRPIMATALFALAPSGLACAGEWFLDVVIVTDTQAHAIHGEGTDAWARENFDAMAAIFARSPEAPFNPRLVDVVPQSGGDPWTVPPELDDVDAVLALLNSFAAWVDTAALPPHDMALLFSGEEFPPAIVSFTRTFSICQGIPAASIQAPTESTAFNAASLARSLGLALGACNDPPAVRSHPECPDLSASGIEPGACEGFVMSASTSFSSPPDQFSPCSAFDFDTRIVKGALSCLEGNPVVFSDGFEPPMATLDRADPDGFQRVCAGPG